MRKRTLGLGEENGENSKGKYPWHERRDESLRTSVYYCDVDGQEITVYRACDQGIPEYHLAIRGTFELVWTGAGVNKTEITDVSLDLLRRYRAQLRKLTNSASHGLGTVVERKLDDLLGKKSRPPRKESARKRGYNSLD